jgi:DNA-binding NarL/FixJ family response regulator
VIRVLIAEDQAMVRGALASLLSLEDDIEIVAEVERGDLVLDAARRTSPDVALLDIEMPGLDGISAAAELVREVPATRALILTTFGRPGYLRRALEQGASGFLLKDAPAETLFDAVRVVAAGEALLAPTITRRLIAEFARLRPRPQAPPNGLDALTPRETEILALVAEGLSNGEIAERLVLSDETVKTHVSHVLRKLGLRDRAQAVVVAYESGLVVPGA